MNQTGNPEKIMNFFVIGIPLQIFGLIILSMNNSGLDSIIPLLGEAGLAIFLVGISLVGTGIIALIKINDKTPKESIE